MLEELNGENAVVFRGLEFMVYNVASYDAKVFEPFRSGDGVDVLFLRA